MRYGFYLPTRGPTATRDGILALVREGERLGLHSAMIADHIVFPVESQSIYPYTLDGRHPGGGDALETFSILGVVAGATDRLRLVNSVLVLPYRNPVLTAKMAASLDVLSGGRHTLGVGAGWLQEEFEALDSPAFRARGAVTDEWITIFKQLWSQSPASFDGRFYRYSDVRCEPFPVQKPHPPIWVGGESGPALRRTARLGDGWIASPGLTYDEARSQANLYRERCAAYGRQPGAIVLRRDIYVGQSSSEAQAVLQHALGRSYRGIPAEALIAGSVDEVADEFRTFAEIGYTDILVRHLTNNQSEVLGSLERLATVRAALA